ncbi:ParB/RepB/Spo0J family partition protein [Streptomyces sp. NPDC052396]|uniref:ParB/RepB/Spo0J family partition protein n=1 Tax=Streptomyces sp. NPDC052396 TaxID=3365689 RepID=UPI0037D839F2
MTRAADRLGAGTSFAQARPVSARRAAIAAITEAPTSGAEGLAPAELSLTVISQNPDNPREVVGDVSDLAATIREIGLVQAITVAHVEAYLKERPQRAGELEPGAQYVVVDGHRRLAAAREAGLKSIKYVVNDDFASSDESLLEAAFVANYQRENLSDLEEAAALEKLVKHYGSQGKTAKRLGVTQAFISQRLSLLELDPTLQADLEAGLRKVEHVRGLSRLSPEEQRVEADARAEAARLKSEEKRQRRAKDAQQTAEAASAPAEAVVPRGDAGRAHNGVMSASIEPGPAAAASPLPSARTAAQRPVEQPPVTEPARDTAAVLPWDDPAEVLRILRGHMQPVHLKQLAEGLLELV